MHSAPLQDVLLERYSQGERDLRNLGEKLYAVELSNIHLEHCNLEGANLASSRLTHIAFKDVDLGGASLQGAQLSEVSLSGTNLKQANLSHAMLSECDLKFCIFSGASFEGANIKQCQVHHSVFINATYDSTTVFPAGFVPQDRGMIEVSLPPADLSDAPSAEADSDLADLPPLVPDILDGGSDSQPDSQLGSVLPPSESTETLVEGSTRAAELTSEAQQRTYFYRGRRIEQ